MSSTDFSKIKDFYNIVPISDGFHYLCKDADGNYFKHHKAEEEIREHLIFKTSEAAQDYINRYLDPIKYKPEIFGYRVDYLVAEVLD
jgi:hypothetical protein